MDQLAYEAPRICLVLVVLWPNLKTRTSYWIEGVVMAQSNGFKRCHTDLKVAGMLSTMYSTQSVENEFFGATFTCNMTTGLERVLGWSTSFD